MSVHDDGGRGRWIVRRRENGRQRPKRFVDEDAARRFDATVAPAPVAESEAARPPAFRDDRQTRGGSRPPGIPGRFSGRV